MNLQSDRDRFTSPVFVLEDMKAAIQNPEGKKVVINGASTDDDTGSKEKELTEAQVNARVLLFIICFVGAILAAVVFSQTEPLLCLSTVGAIFLILGSMAVFQTKITLDNLPVLLVPFVGLLMTGIPTLMVYQKKHPGAMGFTVDRNMVIKLILVCMVVLGVLFMILPFVNHSKKMARCTEVTDAMCIYRTYHTTEGKKANGRTRRYNLYSPTWQFEKDGVLYVTTERGFTDEDVPQIGEVKKIRYNPNDLGEVYRPLLVKRVAPVSIGCIMTVISILSLYVMK